MKYLSSILAGMKGDVVTATLKTGKEKKVLAGKYEVQSIFIEQELNQIPLARIHLLDGSAPEQDFKASNLDELKPGRDLDIFIGQTGNEDLLFRGVITAQQIQIRQKGPSRLMLEARDPAFRMTIGARRKYFAKVSDREAMEEILQGYGIQPDITPPNPEYIHPELVQHQTTDWDFIITRAEANGLVCRAINGAIRIEPPDTQQTPALGIRFGSDLLDLDLKLDARIQHREVEAVAWDDNRQQTVAVKAREPQRMKEPGAWSNQAMADALQVPDFDLLHSGKLAEEELQAWADAKLLKNRLAKVRGWVRCFGVPNLLPGQTIVLEGVGDHFSGTHYVSGISHTVKGGAWTMDLHLGLQPEWFSQRYPVNYPPAAGLIPAVSGPQIGIVTQLHDDPDSEFRVKLRLPVLDNRDQGIWARIATLDAGAGRGSFFLPEVGDEVLVCFINDDPRDPVMVGMLHSNAKPAPFKAGKENLEKGYVSREGMKLLFQEKEKSVTLTTPAGNSLKVRDDQGNLVAQDQHGNKIILDSKGITLKSTKDIVMDAGGDIQIKAAGNMKLEGANVEGKANAQLKMAGQAQAELSAGGNTIVKGGMVMIN